MNDILKEVETLKKMILDSKEYKDFILYRDNLDSNKQINKIISKIKNVQKILINKQDKNEDTKEELLNYELGEDFSIETAVVVCEIYRHNGEWKFNALGSGFEGGLEALCKNFGINV